MTGCENGEVLGIIRIESSQTRQRFLASQCGRLARPVSLWLWINAVAALQLLAVCEL